MGRPKQAAPSRLPRHPFLSQADRYRPPSCPRPRAPSNPRSSPARTREDREHCSSAAEGARAHGMHSSLGYMPRKAGQLLGNGPLICLDNYFSSSETRNKMKTGSAQWSSRRACQMECCFSLMKFSGCGGVEQSLSAPPRLRFDPTAYVRQRQEHNGVGRLHRSTTSAGSCHVASPTNSGATQTYHGQPCPYFADSLPSSTTAPYAMDTAWKNASVGICTRTVSTVQH